MQRNAVHGDVWDKDVGHYLTRISHEAARAHAVRMMKPGRAYNGVWDEQRDTLVRQEMQRWTECESKLRTFINDPRAGIPRLHEPEFRIPAPSHVARPGRPGRELDTPQPPKLVARAWSEVVVLDRLCEGSKHGPFKAKALATALQDEVTAQRWANRRVYGRPGGADKNTPKPRHLQLRISRSAPVLRPELLTSVGGGLLVPPPTAGLARADSATTSIVRVDAGASAAPYSCS